MGITTHVSCQVLADGFSLCYYENACFKLSSKEVGLVGSPVVHDRFPSAPGKWDDAGTRRLAFADWIPERPASEAVSDTIAGFAEVLSSPTGHLDFTYKDLAALDASLRPQLVPFQHLKEGAARPVRMWEGITRPDAGDTLQQSKPGVHPPLRQQAVPRLRSDRDESIGSSQRGLLQVASDILARRRFARALEHERVSLRDNAGKPSGVVARGRKLLSFWGPPADPPPEQDQSDATRESQAAAPTRGWAAGLLNRMYQRDSTAIVPAAAMAAAASAAAVPARPTSIALADNRAQDGAIEDTRERWVGDSVGGADSHVAHGVVQPEDALPVADGGTGSGQGAGRQGEVPVDNGLRDIVPMRGAATVGDESGNVRVARPGELPVIGTAGDAVARHRDDAGSGAGGYGGAAYGAYDDVAAGAGGVGAVAPMQQLRDMPPSRSALDSATRMEPRRPPVEQLDQPPTIPVARVEPQSLTVGQFNQPASTAGSRWVSAAAAGGQPSGSGRFGLSRQENVRGFSAHSTTVAPEAVPRPVHSEPSQPVVTGQASIVDDRAIPSQPPTSARIPADYSTRSRGTVWVESMWVADAVYAFKQHLWALGASTSFPLLSALVANASAHLRLPPLDVLLISTEVRPAVRGADLRERFGWNGELLRQLIESATGAEPVMGRDAWGGSRDGAPSSLPRGFLLRPASGGTVIVSQRDDLPWGDSSTAPPAICAARAVLLGHKPNFLGGAAEANALRYLLGPSLRLSFPYPGAAEVSARRVRALVIDRTPVDRPFTNPGDILAVLTAYKVDTTYVTGAEYGVLSFAEQARLFNGHNLIIAAHGAALSNVVFCPPRSVVIEIYPRGVWKPTYARVATGAGHTHIPVFSFEHGGARHPDAPWVPPVSTRACSELSYPRITRNACYPWLRALPVAVPKSSFEQALVAALNIEGYSRVEGKWQRRVRPVRPPAVYTRRPSAPSATPRAPPVSGDVLTAGNARREHNQWSELGASAAGATPPQRGTPGTVPVEPPHAQVFHEY